MAGFGVFLSFIRGNFFPAYERREGEKKRGMKVSKLQNVIQTTKQQLFPESKLASRGEREEDKLITIYYYIQWLLIWTIHSPLHGYPDILLHTTWKCFPQNLHLEQHPEQSVGAVGPDSCLQLQTICDPQIYIYSFRFHSLPCSKPGYYHTSVNT